MVFSHSAQDKTFNGFIVETHKSFLVDTLGRLMNKPLWFQGETFSNYKTSSEYYFYIAFNFLNITLLFPSSLPIKKNMMFREPRELNFKGTCISGLIFVGLCKQNI